MLCYYKNKGEPMKKTTVEEFIAEGKLPIEAISPEIIERHNIKVGNITPYTRLKVISTKE
jgi:hypothetical protein